MISNMKLNNSMYRFDGIISNIFVWVILIMFLAPYIYLILGSFKTPGDIQAYPPKIFSKFTFENYICHAYFVAILVRLQPQFCTLSYYPHLLKHH